MRRGELEKWTPPAPQPPPAIEPMPPSGTRHLLWWAALALFVLVATTALGLAWVAALLRIGSAG